MQRESLTRFAWLSVATALFTMLLKLAAFALTGSVGLLSDALETVVNLVAASIVLFTLKTIERPPDATHEYGHDKAEYFSAGIEGALILVAALTILATSINRLLNPQPLERVGIGLFIAGVAALVNLVVGQMLIRRGKRSRSITLEADGHHLMSDVWSSVGVIFGVSIATFSGVVQVDAVVGIAVGLKIGWEGAKIIRRAAGGMMDAPIPAAEREVLEDILNKYVHEYAIEWHGLRTRQSGSRRFVNVHLLLPPDWNVQQAHDLAEAVEGEIARQLPGTVTFTHIEPIGDAAAATDGALEAIHDWA